MKYKNFILLTGFLLFFALFSPITYFQINSAPVSAFRIFLNLNDLEFITLFAFYLLSGISLTMIICSLKKSILGDVLMAFAGTLSFLLLALAIGYLINFIFRSGIGAFEKFYFGDLIILFCLSVFSFDILITQTRKYEPQSKNVSR